jgi:16S rRNA (guanine527-N7)-methyltransferase
LTGITDYEEVQVKHFLDSLTVAQELEIKGGEADYKIIDVGTGAGLPGILLRIVFPGLKLTLLEATARKTRFLEHVIKGMGLKNVEIVTGRAEDAARLPLYREKYGVVVSRAVAPLPVLAELTVPFAGIGGIVIAQKKGEIKGEIKSAEKAIEILGGRVREIKRVTLEGPEDDRCLVIMEKVKETPEKYPRRPGMPGKRPIIG